MLIYIIGAIRGNLLYHQQFAQAEAALRREYSCDIINPAARGTMPESDYAKLSYNAVHRADVVACLWTVWDSFGATMEWHIAQGLGKRMMSISDAYQIKEAK